MKGIAGRAVFIDWYAWAQKKGLEVDAFTSYEVHFVDIIEALKDQGLGVEVFRPGDIIVIRFGYLAQYETMADEKRESLDELYKTQKPDNIGIKPSRELLEFLWNNQIAAICGDTRSLEVWPCKDTEWHLHEWLLAGWGMPIGELFYLEDLAHICSSLGRYVFFMSSSPMNVSFLSFWTASQTWLTVLFPFRFYNRYQEQSRVLPMLWRFSETCQCIPFRLHQESTC